MGQVFSCPGDKYELGSVAGAGKEKLVTIWRRAPKLTGYVNHNAYVCMPRIRSASIPLSLYDTVKNHVETLQKDKEVMKAYVTIRQRMNRGKNRRK